MTQFAHSVHEKTGLRIEASFFKSFAIRKMLVDVTGIEPVTPCLQS
jgi:hypothetical protein